MLLRKVTSNQKPVFYVKYKISNCKNKILKNKKHFTNVFNNSEIKVKVSQKSSWASGYRRKCDNWKATQHTLCDNQKDFRIRITERIPICRLKNVLERFGTNSDVNT